LEKRENPMVEAVPHMNKLDEYLKDIIQAVYSATSVGVAHVKDDPAVVDRALADCEEVLGVVMAGKVEEWVE
jgi:ribulose 1,5-bisphosphate carboxylase large subunit-like protein